METMNGEVSHDIESGTAATATSTSTSTAPATAAAPEAPEAPVPTPESTPTVTAKNTGIKGGKHLRWSRITKEVEVKDLNTGLMRGSIAGPTPTDGEAKEEKNGSDAKSGTNGTSGTIASPPAQFKTILKSVSGFATPGQVIALMGPSGSGKTSILDVLSGRSTYSSGSIHLDSELVTDRVMKKLKKQIAYVKQSDLFFGHLTVRDQLTYTAMLRLPSSWPKSKKVGEVNKIIRQLHLEKCADTPIFMISGGEKKRVNIGTELLTDPSIILLDEPTSGLDSTSAVALMRILHWLAKEAGKTIITSIHQPSSNVFFSFDKLMLLADGNVVYFGTPGESLEYVKGLGLECPEGYNGADHWMDLLVVDSANVANDANGANGAGTTMNGEESGHASDEYLENGSAHQDKPAPSALLQAPSTKKVQIQGSSKQTLIDAWDAERFSQKIEAEIASALQQDSGIDGSARRSLRSVRNLTKRMSSRLTGNSSNINATDHSTGATNTTTAESAVLSEKSFNSTWLTQYTVLVHRSMKNSRSAIFTPLNLIKAGAIGTMCGLLWFQMPYTESSVYDRSSYVFFTMTFWVFDAMFTAYMAFPLERSIIFKERASGSYHLSAYFLAKTTSEAPARLALPAIYMIISYWLSGVNNNFGIFVGSTVCSLLSVLAGESIGLFMGAAIMDMEKGMVIMTVTSLGLMVIGGFFVRNIPSWLQWLSYVSPFKYSYNSSMNMIFNHPVPCDGSGQLPSCEGLSEGYASVVEVKEFLGVEGSAGLNAGILFLLFAGIRILAFYALRSKKAEERMA